MKKGFHSFAVAACAVLLAVCVFPAASAFAHPGDAKAAFEAGTKEAMEKFVEHARTDFDTALKKEGIHGAALFYKSLQKAPWKYENTYVLSIEEIGYSAVVHPKNNRRLSGRVLSGFPTVMKLRDMAKKVRRPSDGHGPAVCTQYEHYQGGKRWACAIPYRSPSKLELDLIAGFDHAEDDPRIKPAPCPSHATPTTTADDLEKNPNDETLKKFVEEAARIVVAGFKDPKVRLGILGCFISDPQLQNINDAKGDPTGEGSIYVYVMTSQTSVFINGNNPDLRGDTFRGITDEDGVDISAEILKTATGVGVGGFIDYKWDNPSVMGDEVNEKGKSPGKSLKRVYVLGIDVSEVLSNAPGDPYAIVGAGYYPKQDMTPAPAPMKDSDSGCAIAGVGANSGSSAFGIFLAVFSICFVLCMRSRQRT